jgi:hypothetical protein
MALDENQLKYKRVYDLSDEEVSYKKYLLVLDMETYLTRVIVRACCRQEAKNSTKYKIKSIVQVKS